MVELWQSTRTPRACRDAPVAGSRRVFHRNRIKGTWIYTTLSNSGSHGRNRLSTPCTHLSSARTGATQWYYMPDKSMTRGEKPLTSSGLLRACPSGPVIPISRMRFCSWNKTDKHWQTRQDKTLVPASPQRANSLAFWPSLFCSCKCSCVRLLKSPLPSRKSYLTPRYQPGEQTSTNILNSYYEYFHPAILSLLPEVPSVFNLWNAVIFIKVLALLTLHQIKSRLCHWAFRYTFFPTEGITKIMFSWK